MLIVTIHDVAPPMLVAVDRLRAALTSWGIDVVTLLAVPDYHRRAPLEGCPRTVAWLQAAAELAKRTLTNLYNARPAWLDNAHKALDAAVATAYGWHDYTPNMPDEEILKRLLALNLARNHAGTLNSESLL